MANLIYTEITLNRYFDKTFYINLSSDGVRNRTIIDQFNRFGITDFERVEAKRLTEVPSWDKYRNFNKKDIKYLLGSLSCRASHLECIKIARERGYKKVMILKDDAHFLSNPNELLNQNQEI